MTISDFVKDYSTAMDKAKFCEKHIINKYVPYEKKIDTCANIVETTMYKRISDNEKIYFRNTPAQYVIFSLSVISLYYDVEIDFTKLLECFNSLDEIGAIDVMQACIQESEMIKFNTILNMIIDDRCDNERSLVGFIDNKFKAFEIFVNSISEVLSSDETKNALVDALNNIN